MFQGFDLSGRVAVVIGGTSGIGRAIARGLAEAGADVVATGRRQALVDEAATEIEAMGRRTARLTVDVSDRGSLEALRDGVTAQLGPCDILVTAAGQARPGQFQELDDEVFRRMVEVDYFGTLYAVRAVVPSMAERGTGSIVAICSATGILGIYGYTAYAPAKYAVRGLMECLRDELRPRGVHVACVYPPDVDTPQLAEENLYKPKETAAISGTVKAMTAEAVASAVIRAIDRKRFTVFPDRSIGLLATFGPLIAPILRRLIDRNVRQAQAVTPA